MKKFLQLRECDALSRWVKASFTLLLFAVPIVSEAQPATSNTRLIATLKQLIGDSPSAIVASDLDTGKQIVSINGENPLKPASVMKLATSAAALKMLGPEYRWHTEITIAPVVLGKSERVSIRGVGDPSLTIESLWMIAREIYKKGVRHIQQLNFDQSAFVEMKLRSGSRAYEGGVSALAFNFNSIGFTICPTKAGQPARVISDPWEAGQEIKGRIITQERIKNPLSLEDHSSCQGLQCKLSFRVAGELNPQSSCIQMYRSVEHPAYYIAQVLRELLRQLGIGGAMTLSFKPLAKNTDLSFAHASKPLRDVLIGLNNFSTNVTAEQIVYAIGERNRSFSSEHGLELINQYLEGVGVVKAERQIIDGSGLSHDNRLSARAIVKVLEAQFKNQRVGIEFQASLSIWGRSGTLKTRKPLSAPVVVRGKTGSLDGVSTIAGYIFNDKSAPIAFAVLQNQVASKAKAVDIEDKVIRALVSALVL